VKKSKVLSVVTAVILAVSATSFSQQPANGAGAGTGSANSGGTRYNTAGDRIIDYFDVHAADLKSVLRQLSAYSGVDIVASDAAKATVSVTVSNKSWREVLAIICMVHNLAAIEEQTFMYVMGKDEAAMRGLATGGGAVAGVGPSDAAQMFSPLLREVVPLRFTTASEMAPSITAFLSPRGKLTPVQHTNSLILVDTDENLTQLRNLIEQIDIQTAQISISCKIIEVSSGMTQKLGLHLGWYWNGNQAGGAANATAQQILDGAAGNFIGDAMHSGTYGLIRNNVELTAALDFLFSDNKAEMVAQPQITTLNNKEARIFMGQQIPINRVDESGNTVTEMVQAGTELIVTPYVAGEGKVMLSLKPKNESATITAAGPIINEQSAVTNVLVSNGETVVIAGLTKNDKQEEESGIPFLKSIPIIGNLFKRSMKRDEKRDLVIFVTPHIIHSGI
jgi:type IV pilus assembly protein PilQ